MLNPREIPEENVLSGKKMTSCSNVSDKTVKFLPKQEPNCSVFSQCLHPGEGTVNIMCLYPMCSILSQL